MKDNFEKFRANEKLVEIIRPGILVHVVPKWIWFLLLGGTIAGTVAVLVLLQWPLFTQISVGIFIGAVVSVVGRHLTKIYGSSLVLTNRRLIENKRLGFFHVARAEWHYDQIYRVRFIKKGIWAKIANSGYLKIEPLGGNQSVVVGPVSNPEKIQNLILELQNEYIKHTRMGYFNPLMDQSNRISSGGEERDAAGQLSYGELMNFVRKMMEWENTRNMATRDGNNRSAVDLRQSQGNNRSYIS